MRVDYHAPARTDEWLEAQCRAIVDAGRALNQVVSQVNARTEAALVGQLGRRQRATELQLREAEEACRTLHDIQVAVQNTLFDCEHELRDLRERDVNPAELLIDGERLIRQYRFLRRRARIIDGLLAYLPAACTQSNACLEYLRSIRNGGNGISLLAIPDCSFALVALDEAREEEGRR